MGILICDGEKKLWCKSMRVTLRRMTLEHKKIFFFNSRDLIKISASDQNVGIASTMALWCLCKSLSANAIRYNQLCTISNLSSYRVHALCLFTLCRRDSVSLFSSSFLSRLMQFKLKENQKSQNCTHWP